MDLFTISSIALISLGSLSSAYLVWFHLVGGERRLPEDDEIDLLICNNEGIFFGFKTIQIDK